jgi:hypothetical protein
VRSHCCHENGFAGVFCGGVFAAVYIHCMIAIADSTVTIARNMIALSGSKCRDERRLKYDGINTIVNNQPNSIMRRHQTTKGEELGTTASDFV